MTFAKSLTLAAVLASTAATGAFAESHGGAPVLTGRLGEQTYLMDANKMTLYTFDKDARGVSNCYDDCAVKWPPVMGDAGMSMGAGYSVIERKDGGKQIAHKGQPLYLWFKDQAPGDMTGDGIKGVWHVARP